MRRIVEVLARFPRDELSVHRLYAHDAGFRGVCDDYEEAVAALHRWETTDQARARDFRRLAAELESEIATFLASPRRGGRD